MAGRIITSYIPPSQYISVSGCTFFTNSAIGLQPVVFSYHSIDIGGVPRRDAESQCLIACLNIATSSRFSNSRTVLLKTLHSSYATDLGLISRGNQFQTTSSLPIQVLVEFTMRNMDLDMPSSPGAPAAYGHACKSCAQSKIKCIIRPADGPCERSASCSMSYPMTKKLNCSDAVDCTENAAQ